MIRCGLLPVVALLFGNLESLTIINVPDVPGRLGPTMWDCIAHACALWRAETGSSLVSCRVHIPHAAEGDKVYAD